MKNAMIRIPILLNQPPPPLTRQDRLRRVVITITSFTRNLAYYRVGLTAIDKANSDHTFWIHTANNCFDICVLEWCKLFGDGKDPHHWQNIVAEPNHFETTLCGKLKLDKSGFEIYVRSIRFYRDKFLAHLDSERGFNVPHLESAQASVDHYLDHVASAEAKPRDLFDLPESLDQLQQYYAFCEQQAKTVFVSAGLQMPTR